MAGAGYKLFNTGDVLTAAQVNTYLMEQTVMVFADAAARTAALSGVVSEGMISYLKDTNAVEVYNGSAWVASDDPNAIQNTIVDAKGDLITATAADTPARLAVGNNGETLVADSSASTGLRWQGNFAAGKNKIINGDFSIWQRGTSFSVSGYTADRWTALSLQSGDTISQQTFIPGTAPVAGYEGQYFLRIASSATAGGRFFLQRIEDVRTFAGQTVTLSFWAKASSPLTMTSVVGGQNFGSGGSSFVNGTTQSNSLTTSWQRFTHTGTIPSISGKTIGAGSYLEQAFWFNASQTIDIWGVQLEAGNVATAFQTATGTLAGELAACQRYFWRKGGNAVYQAFGNGIATISTSAQVVVPNPVPMRALPTSHGTGNLGLTDSLTTVAVTSSVIAQGGISENLFTFGVASGLTQFRPYILNANNSTNAYIEVTAEL